MTDWVEWAAVAGIASAIVVAVYGLVLLQIQVFTVLLTKYAQLTAKLAQFLTYCINDFLVITCPEYLALTMIQYIVSDWLLLAAFGAMCLVHE